MSLLANFKTKKVKSLFLSITKLDKNGFYLLLDDILDFLYIYDDLSSDQKKKKKSHIMERIVHQYGFKKGRDYEEFVGVSKTIKIQNRKKKVFFTVDGFKSLCFLLNNAMTEAIIDYYFKLEEDYIRCLSQSNEENKKIFDKINAYSRQIQEFVVIIEKKKQDYEEISSYIIEEAADKAAKQIQLDTIYTYDSYNNSRIAQYEEEVNALMEMETTKLLFNNYCIYELIKRRYMKAIYINLVNPKIINNVIKRIEREKALTADDDLYIDLDATDDETMPEDDEPAYYSIGFRPSLRRLTHKVYVEKKDGISKLKEYLNHGFKTIEDNIWLISLNTILEFINTN